MTQLLLVPFYLSHWNKNVYGLWLTLQSLINILELFDYGHQGFLQNEFLRVGKRRRLLRKMFWSSVVIGCCLGMVQVLIVAVGCSYGIIPKVLRITGDQVGAFSFLLVLNIFIWWLTGSILGIAGRVLGSIGHYSKFAWWGVGINSVANVLPAFAVMLGAGFKTTGIVQVIGVVLLNIPLAIHLWLLLNWEGMGPTSPNMKLGLRNLVRSQVVTATSLLDRLRQDGIRVLLVPLAGTGATATFATMRTGANVVQQGVGTITGPIMPELMRYLNVRDQERCETAFGTIWIVILAVMVPGATLLQVIAPSLFSWWTHGKIDFDPVLFGTLTCAVLISSASQPAVAVVQGNNLLGTRLTLSLLTGICVLAGMFFWIPVVGVRGVAFALLMAEIISAVGYVGQASRWMASHRMQWPWKAFMRVVLSVGLSSSAILIIACFSRSAFFVVTTTLLVQATLTAGYWRMLPSFAHNKTADVIERKIPFSMGKSLAIRLRSY